MSLIAPAAKNLLEAASRPYRSSGRFAWHFARGKLRHDPYFLRVLERGLLPQEGGLFDVGCGYGLLLALICAARQQYARGEWPPGWPPPPQRLTLAGIELDAGRAQIAARALGNLDADARVARCDMRDAPFPVCSAIAFMDVLLYLDPEEQCAVLEKGIGAVASGGVLILREADAAGGPRFEITRSAVRCISAVRGEARRKLHYRSAGEWRNLLERLGLAVSTEPMSHGTPFSNVLFVGIKR
jgi:SAM-dependent methyltransferase